MEQYNVNLKQLAYGVGLIFNGALEVMRSLADENGNLALAPEENKPSSSEGEESKKPNDPAEKEPEVDLVEVRTILASLAKKGLTKEVKNLLAQHGGSKLSDVDPANYAALLTAAKELDSDA